MVIEWLELARFRNYEKEKFKFNQGVNFIVGRNGQGKTNIVESIYLLTHLKSFRTANLQNLPNFQSPYFQVKAGFRKSGVHHDVSIHLNKKGKQVVLDEKTVKLSSTYIRSFFSTLFAPDHVSSFKSFPNIRRQYFDRLGYLLSLPYFERYQGFTKIQKQKNSLLRQGKTDQLKYWNDLLAKETSEIIRFREDLLDQINQYLDYYFKDLTNRTDKLNLYYKHDFKSADEEEIRKTLEDKTVRELQAGHMILGPHRDQFWFQLDDRLDKETFSQGEYRIAHLSLQLAVNQLIHEQSGFYPVLLLDDVFSELDEKIVEKVIEFTSKCKNQVFITTTEIPEEMLNAESVIQIQEGRQV